MSHDVNILIIDDEIAILRSLSLLLRTKQFNGVVTLNSTEDLESTIQEHKPSIVLLDLHMPNRSGYSVLKYLTENHPSIFTIIISADDTFESKTKCEDLGAYRFLNKPVSIEKLTDTLFEVMEKISPLATTE